MDTARVDIRKLQLLNDRINQCLDALNQVRVSVHGLSHSGATPTAVLPQASPFGAVATDPRLAFGISPLGAPMAAFGAGLSHSPYATPTASFVSSGVPSAAAQIPVWGITGLSHSPIEAESIYNRPVWLDPVLATKVRETFPYAGYALPAVVSVF